MTESQVSSKVNKPSEFLLTRRAGNRSVGVITSEEKAQTGEVIVERMGAMVDGDVGRVGVSSTKLHLIMMFGFHVLSSKYCDMKALSMVLGRLVHALEFRRPLLGSLNEIWQYQYWQSRTMLSLTSINELLCVFCMLPLAHTNIRASVDSKVTCSDASMSGGGICISKGITQHGLDALTECQHAPLDAVQFINPEDEKIGTLKMKSIRIICVGLFDGLGGRYSY